MAVTRKRLRQRISEIMGDWRELDVTSNGSTTTFVSTHTLDYAEEDDAFPRWHLAITTLAAAINTFEDRTVKRSGGFTASSGTLTVGRAYSGTPVTTTPDVGELHRYSPTNMHVAIDRAIEFLHGRNILLPVEDTSLVVGNRITNGSFENWVSSSSVAGWTASGGSTQLRSGDRVIDGNSSMSFTADGGDTLSQDLFTFIDEKSTTLINLGAGLTTTQTDVPVDDGTVFSIGDKILIESERMRVLGVASDTIYVERNIDGTSAATHANNTSISFIRPSLNVRGLVGKTLRFEGWVFATAASAGRLRVTFDGSTYTSSAYHGGSDEWEGPGTMYVSVTVPADATQITVICDVAGTQTVFFDAMSCYVSSEKFRYPIPSSIVRTPRQVLHQHDKALADSDYIPVTRWNPALPGHRIKLRGEGRITHPTSETSLIEVSDEVAEVLAAKAAAFTFEMHASDLSDLERDQAIEQANRLHSMAEELIASGVRTGTVPIIPPEGWHVERDGEANVLVLEAR